MTKEQLIYECAAEAVMRARIKLRPKAPGYFTEYLEQLDTLLAETQQNVGKYAVAAYKVNARKCKSWRDVIKE